MHLSEGPKTMTATIRSPSGYRIGKVRWSWKWRIRIDRVEHIVIKSTIAEKKIERNEFRFYIEIIAVKIYTHRCAQLYKNERIVSVCVWAFDVESINIMCTTYIAVVLRVCGRADFRYINSDTFL